MTVGREISAHRFVLVWVQDDEWVHCDFPTEEEAVCFFNELSREAPVEKVYLAYLSAPLQ